MMSKLQLTSIQTKAIDKQVTNPDRNILVSAAAGCGKTFVMIERIVAKLLNEKVGDGGNLSSEPVNLNEMIIVTFTEAAASELVEKLDANLNKRLKEAEKDNDIEKQEQIKKQISYLSDAYISTFHALYLRLLKENKAEFLFQSPINIIDDIQNMKLKQACFNKIEQKYMSEKDFLLFKRQYDKPNRFGNLFELFDNTLEYCLANGGVDKFVNKDFPKLSSDAFNYPIFGNIMKDYILNALYKIEILWIASLKLLPEYSDEIQGKLSEITYLKNNINNMNYNELYEYFNREPNQIPIIENLSLDKKYDKDIKAKYKKLSDNIKTVLNSTLKGKVFAFDEDDYFKIIENSNYYTKALLKYVKEYYELLSEEKLRTGLLSFDDLELEMLKMLYHDGQYTEIALHLQKQFKEIMIDEYQDTSLNQDMIVKALADGSKTFMVGDVKQSIYKFRKATPKIFVDKKDAYQLEENKHLLLELSHNFRSKKYVLDTTNFIFEKTFSQHFGELEYDEMQQLNCGKMIGIFDEIAKNQPELDVSVIREQSTKKMLDYLADDSKFNDETKQKVAQKMSEVLGKPTQLLINLYNSEDNHNVEELYKQTSKAVVNEIQKLIDSGANYRDITILLRNRNKVELLTKMMDESQIPYMLHLNKGFFDSYPIKDLFNLLHALVDNSDESYLYASLHSYFFNLSTDDIYQLSLMEERKLLDKLKASEHEEIFKKIIRLKSLAKNSDPLTLINEIYKTTPYLNLYTKNTSTKHYEDLMVHLNFLKQEIANNLDYYTNLADFISDLKEAIEDKIDSASPALLSGKSNVVNIMTIHRSKGLEFEYVFLMDESELDKSKSDPITFYEDRFNLKEYIDENQELKISHPFNRLVTFAKRKEEREEIARLFYVALTRAKEQLFIFRNISEDEYQDMLNALKLENSNLFSSNLMVNTKKMSDSLIYSVLSIDLNKPVYELEVPFLQVKPYDLNDPQIQQKKVDESKTIVTKKYLSKYTKVDKITFDNNVDEESKLDFSKISTFDTYKQGSAAHKVLELLDFKSANIEENLNNLASKFNIHKDNQEGIQAFIDSEMFKIIQANTYHKEYSFITNDEEAEVGIIDLYVETPDMIYIIDYKSDHISVNQLKDNYSSQLEFYKTVIEKLDKNKPIELYIYSLHNKEFISIP